MTTNPVRGALRLMLIVCTVASAACARPSPAGEQAVSRPDGPQMFARACSKCHASDGTGGLPMALNGPRPINFHDSVWQAARTDAEIVAAIRDGRGAMPPFGDVLKSDEIAALAVYVRSLNSETR